MELKNPSGESHNRDMDQLWAQGSNPGTKSVKICRWDLCVLSRLCQSFCETKSLDRRTVKFNMSYARAAPSNLLTLCYCEGSFQTHYANRYQSAEEPLKEGDLVYLSMKNLNLVKHQAWKLMPMFIGPYNHVWPDKHWHEFPCLMFHQVEIRI